MRTAFKYLLPLIAVLASVPASAAPAAIPSDWNPTRFILVFLAVALVFANGLLAYVLRQLANAMLEKKQRDSASGGSKATVLLLGSLLTAIGANARDAGEDLATHASDPLAGGIPAAEFWFLSGLTGFLLTCMIVLVLLVRMMSRGLRDVPIRVGSIFDLRRNVLDNINKSVAVEEESDILLDHDYDGIRELDNDLPPWWKWGFVATIVSATLYLGYYHAWGGPNQAEEYETAVRKAEIAKAAYLAKSGEKIDETTVTLVLDAGQLGEAKELFTNVCGACHRADGGGAVGPNLTDDHWLHGGSLQDVFRSVKYGWRDKGMPPWNGNLSGKQIAGIASYIKGLKGSNPPGGKAPQGDLFVEGGDKAIDSLSDQTEPSLTPTGTTENKDNPIGPFKKGEDGKGAGTPPGPAGGAEAARCRTRTIAWLKR